MLNICLHKYAFANYWYHDIVPGSMTSPTHVARNEEEASYSSPIHDLLAKCCTSF